MSDLLSGNNCLVCSFSQRFHWDWFSQLLSSRAGQQVCFHSQHLHICWLAKHNQKAKHLFCKCTSPHTQSALFQPSVPPAAAAKSEAISLDLWKEACRLGSSHPGLFHSEREAAVNDRPSLPRHSFKLPIAACSPLICDLSRRSAFSLHTNPQEQHRGSSSDLSCTLTQSLLSARWWSPEGGCQ